MEQKEGASAKRRLELLDTLRGLTLISMFIYHTTWDLVYLYHLPWDWYQGTGAFLWQQSICWTFILLSGFCWPLGKKPLRRGLTVFLCGAAVTAVTLLIMPENRVVFGVLTLLGSCMLLMIPLDRGLRRVPPAAGAIASFSLFLFFSPVNSGTLGLGILSFSLPDRLYSNLFTTYLGFPASDFFSTDYFSLLPWFFLFLTGYFLGRWAERKAFPNSFWHFHLRPLSWIGRHSLVLYMAHQPVIYLVLELISRLR